MVRLRAGSSSPFVPFEPPVPIFQFCNVLRMTPGVVTQRGRMLTPTQGVEDGSPGFLLVRGVWVWVASQPGESACAHANAKDCET